VPAAAWEGRMKHEQMKHEQSRKGPGAGIEAAALMSGAFSPDRDAARRRCHDG